MGDPRRTTVEKLTRADIGHIVRLTATPGRSNSEFNVEAVLLDFDSGRRGYRFRFRFYKEDHAGIFFGISEKQWVGPMMPWQPIEVLGRPGEVSVGTSGTDALADRLDPAMQNALAKLQQQSENKN